MFRRFAMTCGNPLNHMIKNILAEMIDSPALWEIRDEIEMDCITYGFCSKPDSFPLPKRVIL
tara:strand:+ start:39 stop:224 length:186 start_codon:yes stop_codon:yes gene_type:complete